ADIVGIAAPDEEEEARAVARDQLIIGRPPSGARRADAGMRTLQLERRQPFETAARLVLHVGDAGRGAAGLVRSVRPANLRQRAAGAELRLEPALLGLQCRSGGRREARKKRVRRGAGRCFGQPELEAQAGVACGAAESRAIGARRGEREKGRRQKRRDEEGRTHLAVTSPARTPPSWPRP